MKKKNMQDFEEASEQERLALAEEAESNGKSFEKDETGKLIKAINYVIKKHMPDLAILKFLPIWRYKEKVEDGKLIEASVSKLSPRDRDIFGYDIRFEVYYHSWSDMSKLEKIKLIYHELSHVQLAYSGVDEEGIKVDKQGRIVFKLVPHDVDFRRFRSELELYGCDGPEKELITYLYKMIRKQGSKERD